VTGPVRRRLGPVAERDFGLLWLAATLSLMGDYAFRLAFITYVITTTRSPTALAVATTALLVPPLVFYLVGGVVGDRARSRKAVLVTADLGRGAAAAAIALLVLGGGQVTGVVLLGVVIGIGNGFFLPASFAYLTEIVAEERLAAANSATSITRQLGIIGGPLLGGALIALAGVSAAFWFDAATFLASALLILAIRGRRDAPPRPTAPARGVRGVLSDARAGFTFVAGTRWLLLTCLAGALANAVFAGNLDISVPLILSPEGVGQAAGLGLFYCLQGAGALAGAVVLARLTVTRTGVTCFAMLTVMAAAITLIGVLPWLWTTYLMALAYGLGLHFFNSLYPTIVQGRTPAELLSRVGSFVFLAFHGLMPLGTLLIGPLIAAAGPRPAAALTGGAVLLLALVVLRAPSVRTLRTERPDPEAGARVTTAEERS
jgi:hypothetical protein